MGLLSNIVEKISLKPGDHIYSWRTAYIYAHHGIYAGEDKVIHFTRRGQEVGTGTLSDLLLVSSSPAHSCPTCLPPLEEGHHGVVSSCLNCFLAGGILYRFEYSVSPALFLAKVRAGTCTLAVSDPDEIVCHRANYLLENGFGCYNVFKNNCEDFAIYCKTGLLVLDHSTMGLSGQAVSIVGEALAAVMPTLLRRLTMGKSGRAVSIVGGPLADVMPTVLRLVTMGQSGQAVSIVGVPLSAVMSSLATMNVYGIVAHAVVGYCGSRYAADIGVRRDVVKVDVEDLTRELAAGEIQVLEPAMAASPATAD